MKRIAILALLILAGCQSSTLSKTETDHVFATAMPPTAELRTYLAQQAKFYLIDPYSVRDAGITSVNLFNPKTGYAVVCVRGNAKNRMGGYTGMSNVRIDLYGGKAVNTVEDDPYCNDPRFVWHSFPELEAFRNN